ncbi:MAG: hypothetical protein RL228_1192 [Actinomycetota bacterium]
MSLFRLAWKDAPMTDNPLLAGLDENQRLAVEAVRGRVSIIATAGSGKTRVITNRIAHAIQTKAQDAETGLALTFTNKAASEIRGRLARLKIPPVAAATFHATALRQLSHFWPQVVGGQMWSVISTKSSLIEQAATDARINLTDFTRRSVIGEIEWAKSSGLDGEGYLKLDRKVDDISGQMIVDIWGRYTDLTKRRQVLDFEDILQLNLGMLANFPDILQQVRMRYTWFTVDEFQDVTPLQNSLLQQWVGNRNEICVVGDPAQTIYTFAGASANYLQEFKRNHPETLQIELNRTYRCPESICIVANNLMNLSPTPSAMVSANSDNGQVELKHYSDEEVEANEIANQILALIDSGVDPRDIAVLLRINSMSQVFETAFEYLNIPYSMRGLTRFFERPEVKQMLLDLRVGSYISSGIDLVEAVKQVATLHGWTELPKYSSESARSKWESLSALINVAVDLKTHNPSASFEEYFAEIAHRTNENYDPQAAAVTISTIHTAKGLEWDHVFIPSVVEGILPFDPKRAPENTEEERRLFYVAITRAKQAVHISTSKTRLGYENAPSRFLSSVSSTAEAFLAPILQGKVSQPAIRKEYKVEKCRICDAGINQIRELAIKICSQCEKKQPKTKFSESVKTGLKSWREDYAKQAEMLPWLLLSDLAIDALAEFQPKSIEELDDIHGINSAKADVIGEEILLVIAANQHD